MAFRGEEPVGRISAHENNQHIRAHRDGAGFFGFFECINDQAVANALFDAASNWLRERGLKVMRGPLNFSVNDEVGLLTDAFDEPPLIRMTYNPPYYAGLIEGYGLQKIQDLYAYAMFESEAFPKRFRRTLPVSRLRTPSSSSGRWMREISPMKWTGSRGYTRRPGPRTGAPCP